MIGRTREADSGLERDHIRVDIDDSEQQVRLFRCGKQVADAGSTRSWPVVRDNVELLDKSGRSQLA
jgi:hypothetical protein